MLSQDQVVMVKADLKKGYIGSMDVIETAYTTDGHHKQVKTTATVLSGIPCRISFAGSPKTGAGDVSEAPQTVKIYFDSDYAVKTGSRLDVTQNGVTNSYRHTGKEARYQTHVEVEAEPVERWA